MSRRPVDLSFGNSIIGAFAQGRAEALERLRNKQVQDQLAIENEQRRQAAEEDRRQFEAQLNQQKLQHEANQKLAQLGYELNLSKGKVDIEGALRDIVKSGGTPSGYAPVGIPGLNEQVRNMPNIIGQPSYEQELVQFKRQNQDANLPETIIERNPEALRRELALAKQQELNQTLGRQKDLELFKSDLISAEKEAELKQNAILRREEMQKDLEVARINASRAGKDANLSEFGALYASNPSLFYDPKVGTAHDKMVGAAEVKKQFGIDLISSGEKIATERGLRALDLIKELKEGLNNGKFESGFIAKRSSEILQSGAAYYTARKINELTGNLAIPEMEAFKFLGRFSDADLKLMTNATSPIDIGLPKKELIAELEKREKLLNSVIKKTAPKITPANLGPTNSTKRRPIDMFGQ